MTNSKKQRIKEGILCILLIGTLLSSCKEKPKNDIKINICKDEEAFASYSNGYVYIGTKEYIDSIREKTTDKDILIINETDKDDPNFKICESFRITSSMQRAEIIKILLKYEELNPSSWDRSEKSLKNEWEMHNIAYYLNYQRYRTTDVDFNNEDEMNYQNKSLSLFLVDR